MRVAVIVCEYLTLV